MAVAANCERNLLRGLWATRPWERLDAWEASRRWICCALRCRFGESCHRDFFKHIQLHLERGLPAPCFRIPRTPIFLPPHKQLSRRTRVKPRVVVANDGKFGQRSFVYEEAGGLRLILGSFVLPERRFLEGFWGCECPLYGDEYTCAREYAEGVGGQVQGLAFSEWGWPAMGVSGEQRGPFPMATPLERAKNCLESEIKPLVSENQALKATLADKDKEIAALKRQLAERPVAPTVGQTMAPPRQTAPPPPPPPQVVSTGITPEQLAAVTKQRDDAQTAARLCGDRLTAKDAQITELAKRAEACEAATQNAQQQQQQQGVAANQCATDLAAARGALTDANAKNADAAKEIARLQGLLANKAEVQCLKDQNRQVQDALNRAKAEIDKALVAAQAANCPATGPTSTLVAPPPSATLRTRPAYQQAPLANPELERVRQLGLARQQLGTQLGGPGEFKGQAVQGGRRRTGGGQKAILYRPVTMPSAGFYPQVPLRAQNPTLRPSLRTAGAFFSPTLVHPPHNLSPNAPSVSPAGPPIHFPVRTPQAYPT